MSDCNQKDYRNMRSMTGYTRGTTCSYNNNNRRDNNVRYNNARQNNSCCDNMRNSNERQGNSCCNNMHQGNERSGNSCNSMRQGNMRQGNNCCENSRNDMHCHHKMDDGMDGMHLAMGYVPWQRWRSVYEPEKAMRRYTIFEELDKPFMGCRGGKGR